MRLSSLSESEDRGKMTWLQAPKSAFTTEEGLDMLRYG